MKSIINQIKICKDEFLCDFCVCLGGAAFGIICCLIVDFLSKGSERAWGRGIITMFSFLLGMLVLVITGVISVAFHFNLTVSMSSTRKEYLAGRITVILLRFITVYAVTGIIYLLEGNVNASYYGVDMSNVFSLVMIAVMAGGTALILFIGACILKYGNKILWIFWMFWMALCVIPSRAAADYRNHTGSIFDKIGQIAISITETFTSVTAGIVGMLFVIILFLVSAKMLLKQKVEY